MLCVHKASLIERRKPRSAQASHPLDPSSRLPIDGPPSGTGVLDVEINDDMALVRSATWYALYPCEAQFVFLLYYWAAPYNMDSGSHSALGVLAVKIRADKDTSRTGHPSRPPFIYCHQLSSCVQLLTHQVIVIGHWYRPSGSEFHFPPILAK